MNCPYCGSPIPANTASCPTCGAKCEVQSIPTTSAPIPAKEPVLNTEQLAFTFFPCAAPAKEPVLNTEQLAFYAEYEENYRKKMHIAKKLMIAIPIIWLVLIFSFLVDIFAGIICVAGGGMFGIFCFAGVSIFYVENAQKLEMIQRERLFHKA